ncbi:hypothetical protein AB1Y20_020702 [Prymnesium parvum]|uniref:Uncharacterized protein n=1 Tax=Prymnesium parvum TaxID=97485 RepID=A0AB34JYE1_PRYPA
MASSLRHPWADAHRLLRGVLRGSAQPELLHAHLHTHAPRARASLPWSSRSAAELALLSDPSFELRGHRLEPIARQLLVQLSEELQLSELLCCELLLAEASLAPPHEQLAPAELKERLVCAWHKERHALLLLLADCLKLCHQPAHEQRAAQPIAAAFVRELDDADVPGGGGGLALRLLRTLEMLQRAGLPQAAAGPRAPELLLTAHCLFFACASAAAALPAAAAAALVEQLRRCAQDLGPAPLTDTLFLAAASLPSAASLRSHLTPWVDASLATPHPSFAHAACLALDLACALADDDLSLPPWLPSRAEVPLAALAQLCSRRPAADPLLAAVYPRLTRLHAHSPAHREMFAQPKGFAALLRLAAALAAAAPALAAEWWDDEGLVAFAYDTGCRLGAQPSLYEAYVAMLVALSAAAAAERCDALLHRPSMQQFAPALTLMIPEYVDEQLDAIHKLQQRSMTAQADDVLREMVERFPRWEAALSLFATLATHSERFRREWVDRAIPPLVRLQYQGVSHRLKAAALHCLAAFARPPAAESGVAIDESASIASRALLSPDDAGSAGPRSTPQELLAGLREDFAVEQRHHAYPETEAFLGLLRQMLASWMGAALPPPPGVGGHVQWIAEDLFPSLPSLEFHEPAARWGLAAACVRLFAQLLTAPPLAARDDAPPPAELPPHFALLCAFAARASRLYATLLRLLTAAAAALHAQPPPPHDAAAALLRLLSSLLPLLHALLRREAPLYATLQNLRHQLAASPHPSRALALPHPAEPSASLAHRLAAPPRRGDVSPLASLLSLLAAATPAHPSLLAAALAALRRALRVIDTGFLALMRSEGAEAHAREAFVLLVQAAAPADAPAESDAPPVEFDPPCLPAGQSLHLPDEEMYNPAYHTIVLFLEDMTLCASAASSRTPLIVELLELEDTPPPASRPPPPRAVALLEALLAATHPSDPPLAEATLRLLCQLAHASSASLPFLRLARASRLLPHLLASLPSTLASPPSLASPSSLRALASTLRLAAAELRALHAAAARPAAADARAARASLRAALCGGAPPLVCALIARLCAAGRDATAGEASEAARAVADALLACRALLLHLLRPDHAPPHEAAELPHALLLAALAELRRCAAAPRLGALLCACALPALRAPPHPPPRRRRRRRRRRLLAAALLYRLLALPAAAAAPLLLDLHAAAPPLLPALARDGCRAASPADAAPPLALLAALLRLEAAAPTAAAPPPPPSPSPSRRRRRPPARPPPPRPPHLAAERAVRAAAAVLTHAVLLSRRAAPLPPASPLASGALLHAARAHFLDAWPADASRAAAYLSLLVPLLQLMSAAALCCDAPHDVRALLRAFLCHTPSRLPAMLRLLRLPFQYDAASLPPLVPRAVALLVALLLFLHARGAADDPILAAAQHEFTDAAVYLLPALASRLPAAAAAPLAPPHADGGLRHAVAQLLAFCDRVHLAPCAWSPLALLRPAAAPPRLLALGALLSWMGRRLHQHEAAGGGGAAELLAAARRVLLPLRKEDLSHPSAARLLPLLEFVSGGS